MNRHISTQEVFADATKWAKEIPQSSPHSFDCIGVDLKDIIVVVVSRPFLDTMSNRGMLTLDTLAGFKLISEDMTIGQGEAMDMSDQGLGLCAVNHLQTYLSARRPDGTQHRRTSIGISACTTPFVRRVLDDFVTFGFQIRNRGIRL